MVYFLMPGGSGASPRPAPRPGPLAAALSTAWVQAAARPISEAADAALHDLERAAHRPGGRILPRSRWSADERNAFGNWA